MSDIHSFRSPAVPLPEAIFPDHPEAVWRLDDRRIVRTLRGVATALLLAGLSGALMRLYLPDFAGRDVFVELTDLNGEANLPATFSGLLLLGAALILGAIARVTRPGPGAFRRAWIGLALVFFYLATDEYARLHEPLVRPLRRLLDTQGALAPAWVLPYGLLCLLLLLWLTAFLRHLPARTRTPLLLSGGMYVSGALGLEIVNGWLLAPAAQGGLPDKLLSTAEEGLEMFGVILFIGVLLRYARRERRGLTVRLELPPAGPGR